MKKILFLVVLVVMCLSLFAQVEFTPYGSARVGFWYDINDPDIDNVDSRTSFNMDLQGNSRFGVNFSNGDLSANVELGYRDGAGNAHIRHLWAKQSFGNWSLLAGYTEDGTNEGAGQVAFNDRMLRGWGAVYNGRNPMIRFEMDNGFYAALIQPHTKNDPAGNNDGIDALIPRINAGWRFNIGDVKIHPTFAFQMYQYNEDHGTNHDGDVMSMLGAITADFRYSAWSFKLHGNFGINMAEMGYGVPLAAGWDAADNETVDVTSFGGFATAGYRISPVISVGAGFGYASHDLDNDEDSFDRMAFYLQPAFRLQENLLITPEFGMLMDDLNADSNPTVMYFGAQFRIDF